MDIVNFVINFVFFFVENKICDFIRVIENDYYVF